MNSSMSIAPLLSWSISLMTELICFGVRLIPRDMMTYLIKGKNWKVKELKLGRCYGSSVIIICLFKFGPKLVFQIVKYHKALRNTLKHHYFEFFKLDSSITTCINLIECIFNLSPTQVYSNLFKPSMEFLHINISTFVFIKLLE